MSQLLSPQEYAARHRESFRAAFDFLNDHFPPVFSYEWFEKADADLSRISMEHEENPLVIHLLLAVYNYLDDESKLRKEDNDNGKTDN